VIPRIGCVLRVALERHVPGGHEQEGTRPVLVVGLPEHIGTPRYPMLIVVPLTTDRHSRWSAASPALYPRLSAGTGGIPSNSIALLDQVRAIDVSRVVGTSGEVPESTMKSILASLKHIFDTHPHRTQGRV